MADQKGRTHEEKQQLADEWNRAQSVGLFAQSHGMSPGSASSLANRLRKEGLALHRYPRGRKPGSAKVAKTDVPQVTNFLNEAGDVEF